MKTIGMLGGMSWESTAEYYRLMNEAVRDRLGGYHSAPTIVDSVDFAEIEAMQSAGDWDAAGRELAKRAARIETAGADLILLCTNTMHRVFPHVQDAVTVPVIHIADAVADMVHAQGISRVGLLGTAFTMEQDFYRERLGARGLDVIVPVVDDRARVHEVIYDELVHGVILESSRREYSEVIDRLVARGAEGVVLGCTEIELLISENDSPVLTFPTTRAHVDAAVAAALQNDTR